MLRADFGGVPDLEELYQEAWTELLELRARGERLTSVRGLLRTIAWRRARDRLRKMKPETLDPTSAALTLEPDSAPPPDEQAQVRLDAVVLRQIVDQLEPRQAAALKLRFDWHLDAREIQERLGVSPKRLEKIVTEAYKSVASQLGVDGEGESAWSRKQRSLLLACEMGLASAAQRERAQRMVDEDATSRAMLREIRSTLRGVAVALPVPVLFEKRVPDPVPLLERVVDAWTSIKNAALGLFGRGPGSSIAIEQAGAGGAALGGGAAAAKVLTACLVAGGGAAICVETGMLGGRAEQPAPRAAQPQPRAVTAPQPSRPRLIQTGGGEEPVARPRERATRRPAARPPASSPAARPDPSPAPPASTEFGVGAIGSSAPASTPAAAPPDGGGEFGP